MRRLSLLLIACLVTLLFLADSISANTPDDWRVTPETGRYAKGWVHSTSGAVASLRIKSETDFDFVQSIKVTGQPTNVDLLEETSYRINLLFASSEARYDVKLLDQARWAAIGFELDRDGGTRTVDVLLLTLKVMGKLSDLGCVDSVIADSIVESWQYFAVLEPYMNAVGQRLQAGDLVGAGTELVEGLRVMLPILPDVLYSAGESCWDLLAEAVAKRIATWAVPVVGQVVMALDLASIAWDIGTFLGEQLWPWDGPYTLAFSYTPPTQPGTETPTQPPGPSDPDGDGITGTADRCPSDPEDRDGFEDSDGCPDLDNDRDGIPDNSDQCRDSAEDRDGYQDSDGCPEGAPPSTDPDDNRVISSGQTLAGTIEPAGDLDTYYFNAVAGQTATIAMNRTSGNLQPYLYLDDPNGNTLTSDDDWDSDFRALIDGYALSTTGRYQIRALSCCGPNHNYSTGGYNLSLTLKGPDTPTVSPPTVSPPTVSPPTVPPPTVPPPTVPPPTAPTGEAPELSVTWHAPAAFQYGEPAEIWIELCNEGGDASLFTDGAIGGYSTGAGNYSIDSGQCLDLGFAGGTGPIITEQYIQDSKVSYWVYFEATNSHGSDTYDETHWIPVVGIPTGKAPELSVTWHAPAAFQYGEPAEIWIEVCNEGGDASLFTDGAIGGYSTGAGNYSIDSGQCLDLGFAGGTGPIITEQYIQDGKVSYWVYFEATNSHGSDTYDETHWIPVVGIP